MKLVRAEKVNSERFLRACRIQLLRDPVTNVLPLGDIYQPLLRACTVFGAFENNVVVGVCSVFRGFRTPSVVLGTAEPHVRQTLIEKALDEVSEEFISPCEADDIDLFEKCATVLESHLEQQMIATSTKQHGTESIDVMRVHKSCLELLDRFYTQHQAQVWYPLQFAVGPYFCVERQGEIVSAAGVHAVTPKIAQIGNVLTDEAWRRRGFAAACTAALTKKLASDERIVSLFVRKDNTPAIHMYEKLGFRTVRDITFVAMSKRKNSKPSDAL